jgi:hypothetical protein
MPTSLPAGSVDVAPVTSLHAQLLDLRIAQHVAQHRIDARRQASEAIEHENPYGKVRTRRLGTLDSYSTAPLARSMLSQPSPPGRGIDRWISSADHSAVRSATCACRLSPSHAATFTSNATLRLSSPPIAACRPAHLRRSLDLPRVVEGDPGQHEQQQTHQAQRRTDPVPLVQLPHPERAALLSERFRRLWQLTHGYPRFAHTCHPGELRRARMVWMSAESGIPDCTGDSLGGNQESVSIMDRHQAWRPTIPPCIPGVRANAYSSG